MHLRALLASVAATLLLSHAAHGQPAAEPAGVAYPAAASVGGSSLALNGAGVRYKLVFKVYTAGLYLPQRADSADAALAMPGPKRIHVVMLRDIDANELGRLFTRGMEDNAPRQHWVQSIPGTLRMADIFSARKKLLAGDHFSVDYVPGVGTTVIVNGKAAGEPIREPEFFTSLLSIWLGPRPADAALKDALLGREPRPAGSRQ
ncbi:MULTISPECIES: chalcone isomerase family protein [Rubrivivax]|uniref:Chalcone isomerase domain-containing protein n=1 Tax=Rubrivivax benzoatilyticus TaxID=316997 RepID=A0ABX0I0M2_9BURK|nr:MULTISPECIES: chalcone isomerase family protein [Rubrivivax]EGJ09287.1 lipoprotein transmembrane [Rubrivivax benzoatilyticus JA2 = ATCC BAA-35]MCD0422457.1 chalcone isomerase family protein [Rubrivivax sp. JA1024]NHL00384.1 hypothetical protein [Rubrivivax benzoatilyticus]NHL26256.1 hypothetical protein [Rubrivivax benzoatilyticus]